MRYLFVLFLLSFAPFTFAQSTFDFQSAYVQYPNLPSGILQTVAWTRTRMVHLDETTQESCMGLPRAFGVMGLFEDGKNYFNENAHIVSDLSGSTIQAQKLNGNVQILAYAKAFSTLFTQYQAQLPYDQSVYFTLDALSEIPDSGAVNLFAKDAQIYEIMKLMNDATFASSHGFQRQHFQLSTVFGVSNLEVLSASRVQVNATGITTQSGVTYTLSQAKSTQYGPAIWNPAPPCNFSSRNGTPVSAITIHTIQGSYAGAISWSQNCSSNVSFHYVIRSSDGQITQMVLEEDKAWHVGSENPYTIGYEHEGYVDNASWYTEAMYQNSADLSRDITNSGYGIPPLRTFYGAATIGTNTLGGCTKIKGHQHYPNQSHTDPGINWNWEKYYRLINNAPSVTTLTSATSTFYDTGGNSANYADDERTIWTISPLNATSITMNFTSFNLESNYDFLFIYDGSSIDDPLIGIYTGTTSPGSITSTGGSLTIEFRSDCATTAAGWEANYTSVISSAEPPVTIIQPSSLWKTSNFDAYATDTDLETSVDGQYYLIADKQVTDADWQANNSAGFVYESFEDNATNWTIQSGSYTLQNGQFNQSSTIESNSNSYVLVPQPFGPEYLYSWDQTFTSSESNQRAGMHFMCSNATLNNRGDSYFVYLRETDNQVHIYSVDADVFTLQQSIPFSIDQQVNYSVKVRYSTQTGWIRVYINDEFVGQWQDATPLTTGNAISLRTGNCAVQFDNVKLYRSRANVIPVSVGITGAMRYESEGAIETGMIEALSVDATSMWSQLANASYLIDRSTPLMDFISDGTSNDIDTTTNSTIHGNWSFQDIHSDIDHYEYAIGTSPGASDVISWTAANLNTTMSELIAVPFYNQIYYLSVRSTNGAGLYSINSSDGQVYLGETNGINDNSLEQLIVYPNPTSDLLFFKNIDSEIAIQLIDGAGKIVLNKRVSTNNTQVSLNQLPAGNYSLLLQKGNQLMVKLISVIH